MKNYRTVILFFAVVSASCSFWFVPSVLADTIVLKEGQTLTGDILAEKDTQLIVDIGVTVVTIPKENILEYEYTEILKGGDIDVNDSDAGTGKSQRPAGRLYRTANLEKTTIEKCVDEFSEAVVKVPPLQGWARAFLSMSRGT